MIICKIFLLAFVVCLMQNFNSAAVNNYPNNYPNNYQNNYPNSQQFVQQENNDISYSGTSTPTRRKDQQNTFAKYTDNDTLDRFSYTYPDGSYEFRYELADGTARYERGYFLLFDKIKTLIVVGYYSYRMPDGRYITVFYNADQNGYRQNQAITAQTYPNLPRTIEVPEHKEHQQSYHPAAPTSNPRISSTTNRF